MESGREFGPRDGILSEREALTVDFVSEPEAKRLLCHYALDTACGSFDPDVHLDCLLQICGGVPTVLIIAGYELQRRGNTASACNKILEEINILGKLEEVEDLRGVMVEVVLEQLEEPYLDAFLDIALFFYGWERSKVADIVGEMKLRNLEGAALVTTSEEGKVMMHDIVRAQATKLHISHYPLRYQNPLCIVLRDQDIATDEGLVNVSDPGGLLDIDEGLLDIDEGVNNFKEAVDLNIWEPPRVLYVINLKESSLRVVVMYEALCSDPAETILATAVFNLDRKLFKDKDYGCHHCGIWMDKDFKPTMTDMEAQSRSDFLIKKFRANLFKAVLFIQTALIRVLKRGHPESRILTYLFYRLSYSLGIEAPTGNHLGLPLRSKILVTARHLNENDIFGDPDGIQVCSHRVYFSKSPEHTVDKRLLYDYASHENMFGYEHLRQLEGEEDLPQCMVDIVCWHLWKDSQDAFMDIAFYFHDWERSKVADIVGGKELKELEEEALVSTSEEGKVKMNDFVRARGRTLSEGNRITDCESLSLVLRDPQKLKQIEGIWLGDGDYVGFEYLKGKHVDLMSKSLRVLYLGDHTRLNGRCKRAFKQLRFLHISYDDLFSKRFKRLRKSKLLSFVVVSLTKRPRNPEAEFTITLPESLQPWQLEVDVPESLPSAYLKFEASNFPRLLNINGPFTSLRELELSFGGFTLISENLGNFSFLKIVRLEYCSQLKRLPQSLGNLCSLQELRLFNCSKLETLPESFGNLSSLQHLDMSHCSMLSILPDSFGNLFSLRILLMPSCSKLEKLPDSFGNLSSLRHLDMSHCSMLERLPHSFEELCSMRTLIMSSCSNLDRLPDNFGNLSSLRHLDITHCPMLLRFPENFGNIFERCAVFLTILED